MRRTPPIPATCLFLWQFLRALAFLLVGLLSESAAHATRLHREALEAKEAERARRAVSFHAKTIRECMGIGSHVVGGETLLPSERV